MRKGFTPPTIEEVKAYIKEKQLNADAEIVWNYYNVQEWKDSRGKPVLNWKGKIWAVWHANHPLTKQKATIQREQQAAKEKRERNIGSADFDELFKAEARRALKPIPEPTTKPVQQQIQELLKAEKQEKPNFYNKPVNQNRNIEAEKRALLALKGSE